MKRALAKLVIPIFALLYRFSYWTLSQLVVWEGMGIHPKHRILRYHSYLSSHVQSTDTVLDIGCGQGGVAADLAKKAARVQGIDISSKNIAIARKRHRRKNLSFVVGDANDYDPGQRYNIVVLSNVLEHIERREQLLKNLHRLTDTILLRVPLIERDWLAVYLRDKGLIYKLDRTHKTEYTVQQVHDEAAAAGWTLKEYKVEFGELLGVLVAK